MILNNINLFVLVHEKVQIQSIGQCTELSSGYSKTWIVRFVQFLRNQISKLNHLFEKLIYYDSYLKVIHCNIGESWTFCRKI